MSIRQIHLSQDLRLALAVLYSLPLQPPHPVIPNSKESHDFLMRFQSRNVRRKVVGLLKSSSSNTQEHQQDVLTRSLEIEDYGSSWLACLAILAATVQPQPNQPKIQYAEALFAAQTLVHRLRRVKLYEAIDLEFEPPLLSIPVHSQQLLERYKSWLGQFGEANLLQVINNYHPRLEDEDVIKGEISILSLTAIFYILTLAHYDELGSIRPLLATLSSAIANIAARLRFTSAALPEPTPNTQPIVTMIFQSLKMVHETLASTSTYPADKQSHAHAYGAYIAMTSIPDAILAGSSGGGAHGRLSMDPRCYTAVTAEVRTQGITQVWQSFSHLPAPNDEQLVLFLHMCEEWAKYAPLPLEFVQRSIPMVNNAFTGLSTEAPSNTSLLLEKQP